MDSIRITGGGVTVSDFSIDYESFSWIDIRDAGTSRYATDPSTEVLMMAISKDGEPPVVWLPEDYRVIWGRKEWDIADEYLEYLEHGLQPGDTVRAFNYLFEYFLTQSYFGFTIPPENWICTQVTARRAGFPNDLKSVAKMCVGQDKDSKGSGLIRKFSIPISAGKRKGERRMPWEDDAAFEEFIQYCIQDVVVEQAVANKVKPFEFKGFARQAFINNHQMNIKGVPINVKAVKHAISLRDEAEAGVEAEFAETVGCKTTQRAQCVDWFNDEGYEYASLDEAHVTRELALSDTESTLSPVGQKMMALRYHVAGAAVKKLDRMLDMVMPDDTVKGCFALGGAQQTGRWSSLQLQFQNMKKPAPGMDTCGFFDLIDAGEPLKRIRKHTEEVHRYMGCSIRHFVEGPFITCDYNAIEARIVGWLAGQDDLVQDFRDGVDVYRKMSAKIFNVTPDDIGKPSPERDLGKAVVLGCGFGLGGQGFYNQAAEVIIGGESEEEKVELAKGYVDLWREENQRIVKFWYACEKAAIAAVNNPGEKVKVRGLTYFCGGVNGRRYLFCKLPSGRTISYLDIKLELQDTPWGEKKMGLAFWCKDPLKVNYRWKKLYGGMLVQGAVQSTAACVMMHGFNNLIKAGFDTRMLIHDESVARLSSTADAEKEARRMEQVMCEMPAWADGLPLVAEAEVIPYYKK